MTTTRIIINTILEGFFSIATGFFVVIPLLIGIANFSYGLILISFIAYILLIPLRIFNIYFLYNLDNFETNIVKITYSAFIKYFGIIMKSTLFQLLIILIITSITFYIGFGNNVLEVIILTILQGLVLFFQTSVFSLIALSHFQDHKNNKLLDKYQLD